MSPSRANDILNTPSDKESGEAVSATPALSLTSVSDKPKAPDAKPATPAAATPSIFEESMLSSSSLAAAAPKSRFASMLSVDNEAQRTFAEKQNQNVVQRYTGGITENLAGQLHGIVEIVGGKRDQIAELKATSTGIKTGNEHALINVAKTTLTVGGVVKDLAADTVGLGDGKTSAALSRAITKGIDDFNKGSAGDRAEMLGGGTGFALTFLIGGGSSAKGATNLGTDVRAIRTLMQTEKQSAAMAEAVTGMRALKTTERVVAATERVVAQNADEVSRIGVAATAKTAPLSTPSLLTRATDALGTWGRNALETLTPRAYEPAFAGAGGFSLRTGGSNAARLVENTAAKAPSALLRTGDEAAGAAGIFSRTPITRSPATRILGLGEDAAVARPRMTTGLTESGVPRIPRQIEVPRPTVADDLVKAGGETPVIKPGVATHVDDAKGAVQAIEGKATTQAPVGQVAGHVDDGKTLATPPKGQVVETPAPRSSAAALVDEGKAVKAPTGQPAAVVDEAAAGTQGAVKAPTGAVDNVTPAPQGAVEVPAGQVRPTVEVPSGQVRPTVEVPSGQIRQAEAVAPRPSAVAEVNTAGDIGQASAQITRRIDDTAKGLDDAIKAVDNVSGPNAQAIKAETTALRQSTRELLQGADDAAATTKINESLVKLEKLGASGGSDEIARLAQQTRELQTSVSTSRRLTALETGTQTMVSTGDNISTQATRLAETTAGKTVKADLDEIARLGKDLGTKGDDVQTLANINERLANISRTAGQGTADEIARVLKPSIQKAESTALHNGALRSAHNVEQKIARVSETLVQSGDDISREVTKLAPKAGTAAEADLAEIARPSRNLGRSGDDLAIVRQIDERVANIARNSGTNVADEVSRAIKPAMQKAENAAVESSTLKVASNIEQRVARMTENMTGPQAAMMRQDVATVQRNVQKLVSGADDANTVRSIERALEDLQRAGGNGKFSDDIARLTEETRQIQSSVSVSRRLAAIERNTVSIAETGTTLGDDALRLAADPAKAAAKADLDEIARLGRNLGQGGDDVAALAKINERVANIGRTAGSEVADDVARALKPTIQKAEATAVESGALRSAANLEQRIARVAETVTGPEAAAVRQNLAALQRTTRGVVNGADDVAKQSDEIQRVLQNLERAGVKTNVADDLARISEDTRQLQTSVAQSRRATALETTSRTLVNDGRAISDEVARISSGTGAKVVQNDLDEISRLSKNLGRTGDDLDTVRKINERVANIGRTAGTDVADDVARTLGPKVQKAEATAIEASRARTIGQVVTTVEQEARSISQITRDITRTVDASTTRGRVLEQQLRAIQRAADDMPTAVNPAQDAARLRTMIAGIDNAALPAAQRTALNTAVRNLDNAATDLSALRTLGTQGRIVEQTATTLRGTVARFQDDVARGTAVVKPGTEEVVRKAITTIDENANAISTKLGTTAKVDGELRNIQTAITQLENAGQTQLARQVSQQFRQLDNASTARTFEINSYRGPAASHVSEQTMITRTIEQIERDFDTLRSFSVRNPGRLDTISDLQDNVTMLRYLGRNNPELLTYAEKAQTALSRTEMLAQAGSGRASWFGPTVESGSRSLVKLAEEGNQQAINRLFVRGLQSNSWSLREMVTTPQTWLNRVGTNTRAFGRAMASWEGAKLGLRTVGDAALLGFGATTLYANYNYHSKLLLSAIARELTAEAQMSPEAALRAQAAEATTGDTDKPAQEPKRAEYTFSPAMSVISRKAFSPVAESMGARYGFSAEDPDADIKVDSIIYTGKQLRWMNQGYQPAVVEESVKPAVPTAKSIRIKADGVSVDPNSHQKIAVTNFSFTRAMALTNQLKLMTNGNDNRGGAGKGNGTVFGGGPSSTPSLSQNLRTMVAFSALRTDSGASHAAIGRRESTEDSGIDQAGGSVAAPQGPQVIAASTGNGSGNDSDPAVGAVSTQAVASNTSTGTVADEAFKAEELV